MRCEMEKMESRRMLAGNVTAAVVGGVLVIKGDVKSNAIVVDSNPDYTTSITPQAGTTVNGKTTATIVTGSPPINVDLGDGDDAVAFTDINQQSVDVLGGKGNDAILAIKGTTANVFGHLAIDAGEGADLVLLSGNNGVASDLTINAGGGIDLVSISGTTGVGNNLTINTDGGLSAVSLFGTYSVGGNVLIDGGSGFDVLIKSQATFAVGGTTTIKNFELIL